MNKFFFVVGFVLMLLPFGLQYLDRGQQENVVSTYWQEMESIDKSEIEESLEEARVYNSKLYRGNEVLETAYTSLLRFSEDGIMGSVEIPKISLNLPIYHGTAEEVLSIGIGHLRESSLPIGGKNTHSILTGHRGLPNAQLFTRLDELEIGDVFFVKTCNQTLIYQVDEIQVIEPEDVEVIEIQPERDLVSLITCTPYGLNTHRLVVTGERIEESEVPSEIIQEKSFSKRDCVLILLPFLFLLIALIKRKRRKKGGRMRKAAMMALFLVCLLIPIDTFAATGNIEILLPDGNIDYVSYEKVADLVDESYILRERYRESHVNLNDLQTADELEKAAEKLELYAQNNTKLSFQQKDSIRILNLEEGAYLFRFDDSKHINPILVFIPTYGEISKEGVYDIMILPKYSENDLSPDTGSKDLLGWYLALFAISLIIILRLACHNRFLCGRMTLNYSEMGGYTYGNDNDTKNPRCPRRIGFSGRRSID